VPETPTPRLSLYKPLNSGSELVNVQQDLNNNWDKVDSAAGFQIVTSGTRPAAPYAGKAIAESDTAYRTYFSNGTAPASGSWVEIPNSSGSYGGNLNLAIGKQLNIGGSLSTAAYACVFGSSTGDFVISSRVTGDGTSRLTLRADGQLGWSSGAAATDVTVQRSSASTLTLTGNLTVTGVGQYQFVRKTADETVTNSAAYQNDDHLVVPVVANGVYQVDGYIVYQTASAAGINLRMTGPTGTGLWTFTGLSASGGTNDTATMRAATGTNGSGTALLGGASGNISASLRGTFTPTASGNLQFEWSQNAANVTGTIVRANSWLALTRVA
jgi:hypothetical protein